MGDGGQRLGVGIWALPGRLQTRTDAYTGTGVRGSLAAHRKFWYNVYEKCFALGTRCMC
jgi:hypothetical protein